MFVKETCLEPNVWSGCFLLAFSEASGANSPSRVVAPAGASNFSRIGGSPWRLGNEIIQPKLIFWGFRFGKQKTCASAGPFPSARSKDENASKWQDDAQTSTGGEVEGFWESLHICNYGWEHQPTNQPKDFPKSVGVAAPLCWNFLLSLRWRRSWRRGTERAEVRRRVESSDRFGSVSSERATA